MDNVEKKDWFGVYYSNQDKNYSDFLQNDVTPSNIELKPKEEYKKNEKVVQAFTNEEGKFDDNAFNNFYSKALSAYNTLSVGKFSESDLPKVQYDLMSPFKSQVSQTQDISLDIIKGKNPFISSQGLNTIFGAETTTLSSRELAQQNKIFDTSTNTWMDKTPEDLGFWGTVKTTPIVLAQWDEDGETTDPETGRKISHSKGELKLDDSGRPYYETLGNRSIHGRQALSAFDVITKENSTWNKFDFFDNDSQESSIGSTIAQTVATIAPLFVPYVGQAYGGALVLREGTKLGITLYKMLDAFMDGGADRKDSDFGILNTIEAKAFQFNTSVSDKSQQEMFTFENFGRLVSDVGTQLFQQRVLAQIPNWLGIGNAERAALKAVKNKYGAEALKEIADGSILKNPGLLDEYMLLDPAIRNAAQKATIRNNILGRFMANFYMSGTSTMDVYNDALDAGYDRRTAAITAGLAMGATTWMIQSTEIGQKALEGLGFDSERSVIRGVGKKFIEENRQALQYLSKNPSDKAGFNNLLRKSMNAFKAIKEPIDNIISSSGVLSNAVSEAIEEVTEEAIMDTSKALTDAFTSITGTHKNASFNFLESNPLERYVMSAFGGAIGGSVFKLASNMSDINAKVPNNAKADIFYLLRNGKKEELLDQLEKYRRQGVAPKNLSTERDVDSEGSTVSYKPAKGNGDSHNDAVIDLSEQLINEWDAIINQEQLNLSDRDIISSASLRDKRVEDLIKFDGRLDMLNDFNQLGIEMAELAMKKKGIENQLNAPGKDIPNKAELEHQLSVVSQQLEEKRLAKDKLLTGEHTEEYTSIALFNLSDISKPIYSANIYTYTENVLGKSYSSLSEQEKADIQRRYKKYRENAKVKVAEAYDLFKSLSEKYGKDILHLVNNIPTLSKIKTFLSNEGQEELMNLIEESKRSFDLARNIGLDLGIPVDRGVDYMFDNRDHDMSDPVTNSIITDFFNNLTLGDLDLKGISFVPTAMTSAELIQDIHSGIGLFRDSNPEFKALKEELLTLPKGEESREVIKNAIFKYLETVLPSNTSINSYPIHKLVQKVEEEYNTGDASVFLDSLNSALSSLDIKLYYDLAPRLKLSTINNLLEAVRNEGMEVTDDIYQYIRNYIKSDSEFELDYNKLNSLYTSYLTEGAEEVLDQDLHNYKNISPELSAAVQEEVEETLGISDLDGFLDILDSLNTATSWFDVAKILKESNLDDSQKKILIDNLNNSNKAKTKSSFYELNTLIDPTIDNAKIVKNPLLELLKKISIDVEGSNGKTSIFDLLAGENALIKSTNTLSDFILQGKVTADQIDTSINVIDLLQSIISSMQNTTTDYGGYGFNSTLNYIREKNGIQQLLPEVDFNLSYEAIAELENIKRKLNFYKQLSEQNKDNKLKEHRLTAISVRQSVLSNIKESIASKMAPELFFGVEDILTKYDLDKLYSRELNDEEYIQLEKVLFEVENKIYDNAEELNTTKHISKESLIEKLFQGYNYSELIKVGSYIPEQLNSETKKLSLPDLFIYYHSILAIRSSRFNSALKEVLTDSLNPENSGSPLLIPIFSQEYAARIATAMVINPTLMNSATTLTPKFENSIPDEKNRDKYKNLITPLKNVVFINGAPGVGKTNGVDKLVYRIVSKLTGDQGAIIVGPEFQQAVNLTNSLLGTEYTENDNINNINNAIKEENAIVFTKDVLFDSILKSPETLTKANEDFYEKEFNGSPEGLYKILKTKDKDDVVITVNSDLLDSKNFKEGVLQDKRIIFLDEVTQLSKLEMEVLSAWASQNDKIIISSGDLVQSGYSSKNGVALRLNTDTSLIYTPSLSTSLRITNIHKKDNSDVLRVLVERVNDENNFYTTGKLNYLEGLKISLSNYDNVPSLKYYEDDTKLNGEKIESFLTKEELHKLVSDSTEPIGYIYDSKTSDTYKVISDYLQEHPKSIKMFELKDVQGSEAKYFVVDLHLDFGKDGANVQKATSDLYTAITRSKEGTIIINNGLTSTLKNGSERIGYTQNSILNNEAAKGFAELRLRALNTILEGTTEPTPETEKTSDVTPERKSEVKKTNQEFNTILTAAFDDNLKSKDTLNDIERRESTIQAHPLDSFICYSYRTRIKPTTTISKEGIETYSIKDSAIMLRLDSNSEHRAFFNGNVDNLSKSDFEKVDSKISEVKSILYNYHAEKRAELFFTYRIASELSTLFEDLTGNTGSLNLQGGKFALKSTKYTKSSGDIDSVMRIVYRIPIINSSTSSDFIELYIAELPNINNPSFKINDKDSDKQKNSKLWFMEYEKFYGQVMNQLSLGDSTKVNSYLELRDDFEPERITNSVIYKGPDKKNFVHVPFEQRESEFRGLYFSKPYIVTNYKPEKENRTEVLFQRNVRLSALYDEYYTTLSKFNEAKGNERQKLQVTLDAIRERIEAERIQHTLKGKAVVFVTHSKYIFDENDELVTEDKYGDYYVKQLNGEYDNDPERRDKIRMIVLNPEGQSFQSFISKYREYINSHKSNSPTGKYTRKFYKSYFGDFTGFDTLLSIYNYSNYLKVSPTSNPKHLKVADKLLGSLQALASKEGSVENPFDLPEPKKQFGLPHAIRILNRIHVEITPEEIKKVENYASTINGNDVLWYLNKIIELKIDQRVHPERLTSQSIVNQKNGGIFQDWSSKSDISDIDIIDFMESAMTGKRITGDVIENYKPMFKDGIYPFPVYEMTDNKTEYVAGNWFYEARTPEGQYYIDRDLQTPQFAFQPSRDLADPSGFGIKRVEKIEESKPKRVIEKKSPEITQEENTDKYINTISSVIESSTNEDVKKFLQHTLDTSTISKSIQDPIAAADTFIESSIKDLNSKLKVSTISLNETEDLDYVEYKNNELISHGRPKVIENTEVNNSLYEKNKLYLQQNFGELFNPITDISDVQIVSDIVSRLLTLDQNNLIYNFIQSSKLDAQTVMLLNTDPNLTRLLSGLNKMRSKYNIC